MEGEAKGGDSVEVPPPVVEVSQELPPSSGDTATEAAAPGDHGEAAGLPITLRPAPARREGPGGEGEEGGGEGTTSLSDVVVGIMNQPRVIADGESVCSVGEEVKG